MPSSVILIWYFGSYLPVVVISALLFARYVHAKYPLAADFRADFGLGVVLGMLAGLLNVFGLLVMLALTAFGKYGIFRQRED